MKIQELVTKVETLSMQEIDELVNNDIEIEDIQYLLLHDEQGFKEKLFKNESLKQVVIKEINKYILSLFQELKSNPNLELTESLKKISQNYLKNYFKDGIDLEITNDRGRNIVEVIRNLRNTNDFFKEQYKDNKIFNKYCNAIQKIIQRDVDNMSQEEILEYNKTLGKFFRNMVIGHNIHEAEFALKIAQRKDIDISKVIGLDYYNDEYTKAKQNPNRGMVREDEVFSVLLDYDIELKNRGINTKTQYKYYSPIEEMKKSIEEGKFGENNILTKQEIAFALKMLQNPDLIDDKRGTELCKFLDSKDIKIELGNREIKFLLDNKNFFDTIGYAFPNFQEKLLEQVENHIISTLENIVNKKRPITQEEMANHSKYLKDFYQISIDKNGDTSRLIRLFSLLSDFEFPNIQYNMIKLPKQKETMEFLGKKSKESNAFMRYFKHVLKIVDKLQSDEDITEEEYLQYDEIIRQLGYRCNIKSDNNVKSIVALEKRSKKMNKVSIAIEERIELYIDQIMKKEKCPEQPQFYESILKYYERQLNDSAIAINQNAAVSHLIRAAQKGKLPENISSSILEKLEERRNKSKTIEADSEEDFDKYISNVAEIRLQQGKMPRECSEFIIKQSILKERDMSKYEGMIERALEDFSEYELQDSKIDDYLVTVVPQAFFGDSKTNGEENNKNKTIQLSRNKLKNQGIIKLIETTLHEITHSIQRENIRAGILNRETYKMLKEQILRYENNKFYDDNYTYMYNEIDARTQGYVKRDKLLKKLGLTDAQIAELVAQKIEEKIEKEEQARKQGKVKTFGEDKKEVNIILAELLQQKPELLEQYPDLQVEFEKNGEIIQRKSLTSILTTYEQLISQTDDKKEIGRISSLYGDILLDGIPIPEEKMQEELEELLELESDNPIVNGYKERLLKEKFTTQQVLAATVKNFYKKKSATQRQDAQKVLKQVVKDKQNTIKREKSVEESEK